MISVHASDAARAPPRAARRVRFSKINRPHPCCDFRLSASVCRTASLAATSSASTPGAAVDAATVAAAASPSTAAAGFADAREERGTRALRFVGRPTGSSSTRSITTFNACRPDSKAAMSARSGSAAHEPYCACTAGTSSCTGPCPTCSQLGNEGSRSVSISRQSRQSPAVATGQRAQKPAAPLASPLRLCAGARTPRTHRTRH